MIQDIKEGFEEKPLYHGALTLIAVVAVTAGMYGFYSAEVIEMEVDVSTGHDSNDSSKAATVHFESTISHLVTPYTASYTAVHGCDWIETVEDVRVENCHINVLGGVLQ